MDLKKISGAAFFGLAVVACLAVMSTHQATEDVKFYGDSLSPDSFAGTEDVDVSSAPSATDRLFSDAMDDDGSTDDDRDMDFTKALHPSLSGMEGEAPQEEEEEAPESDFEEPASPSASMFSSSSDEEEAAPQDEDDSISDGDSVTVEYRLRKPDGETVYTQWGDGDGGDFTLDVGAHHVIPGFENAIAGMKVGEEQDDIQIPSDEAYGEKGGPMGIGPNQDLVYDIKVVAKN